VTTIPFNEQVAIFCREVQKAFDYCALDDFYRSKFAILNGDWSPANIDEVLMRANYNGAIARIAYYKYVHQHGFDVRALWDALILTWMMHGVWSFDLEGATKTSEFKTAMRRFRYPKWVKFGLIGGSIQELKRMGGEFAAEMEALKRVKIE